ncbi:MAG: hypothetical protein ABIP36_04095 [Acidimicrobiales bacterium]
MQRRGALALGGAGVAALLALLGLRVLDDGCDGAGCTARTPENTAVASDATETSTTSDRSVDASIDHVEDILRQIDAELPSATSEEERELTG